MATKQLTFSMGEYDRGGFVSVAAVAKKTSLSLATIYKEIKSGSLIAHNMANKTVLRPGDVERWAQVRSDRITRTSPRSNRGRKKKKKENENREVKGLSNAGTQRPRISA